MIANIVELIWGDKASLKKRAQVWLSVERMFARKTHKSFRPWDPVIRRELIGLINRDELFLVRKRRSLLAVVLPQVMNVLLLVLESAEKSNLLRRVLLP